MPSLNRSTAVAVQVVGVKAAIPDRWLVIQSSNGRNRSSSFWGSILFSSLSCGIASSTLVLISVAMASSSAVYTVLTTGETTALADALALGDGVAGVNDAVAAAGGVGVGTAPGPPVQPATSRATSAAARI